MLDFHKNKLINKVLIESYKTFSITQDTCDYVPKKFNKKIYAYIFKNTKKKFREIEKEERLYQRAQRYKLQAHTDVKQDETCTKRRLRSIKAFIKGLFTRKPKTVTEDS